MSDQLIAEAARHYVRVLNATGQRLNSRDSLLFCEAVEAADAPAAVAAPAVEPAPVEPAPVADTTPVVAPAAPVEDAPIAAQSET